MPLFGRNLGLTTVSTKNILGMRFRDEELQYAARSIVSNASDNIRRFVYFVNAHCVNVAAREVKYKQLLQNTPELYADGIGMAIAARLWGLRLDHNVNGTDLFPLICEYAAKQGVPLAFFGSEPGVADACKEKMTSQYPGLRVVYTRNGFVTEDEQDALLQSINESGAKILLVARGVPLQELWIDRNKDRLDAPVLMGVGALFDFYSGKVQRAPSFLRKIGMEWLYRLYLEPTRLFRRYVIGNPEFLVRALILRIRGNTG
jgi:N-acetylglucosaminyldiphosphoundecaprenol N-acetyl-beta-D-mannosaminyltransferase